MSKTLIGCGFIFLIIAIVFYRKRNTIAIDQNLKLVTLAFTAFSVCLTIFGFVFAKWETSETTEAMIEVLFNEELDYLNSEIKQSNVVSFNDSSKSIVIQKKDNFSELKSMLETDHTEISAIPLTSVNKKTALQIINFKRFLKTEIQKLEKDINRADSMRTTTYHNLKKDTPDNLFKLRLLEARLSFSKFNEENIQAKSKYSYNDIKIEKEKIEEKIEKDTDEEIAKDIGSFTN